MYPDAPDDTDPVAAVQSLPGDAGDSARADLTATPTAFESPIDTTNRLLSDVSQARQYGRMRAADLTARGIANMTTPEGDTKEITDADGAALTSADPRNRIAYDSSGNPVKYGDHDFSGKPNVQLDAGGQPILSDPYASAPTQMDKQGNIYSTPSGLPWKQTGVDQATADKYQADQQAKLNQATISAMGVYETQSRGQVAQATKAVNQSAKSTASTFQQLGVPLTDSGGDPINLKDIDGPTLKAHIEDTFNQQFAQPDANERPWFGPGQFSTSAQALRTDIGNRKQKAMDAADAHLATLDQVDAAQGNLQEISSQRQQLQIAHFQTVQQQRLAAGLPPIEIPGMESGSNDQAAGPTGNAGAPAPVATTGASPSVVPGLEPASSVQATPNPGIPPEDHAKLASAMPPAAQQVLQPPKTDAQGNIQPEGFWGTVGRAFGSKIIPAAATAAGGLGAGLLASETGPGAIAADIAGGAASGYAANKAQRAIMGDQWANANDAQMAANAKAHPIANQIGTIVPFLVSILGGGGAGVKALGLEAKAITGAGKEAVQQAVADGVQTAVPTVERIAQGAAAGARGGASEGAQDPNATPGSVLNATAKTALEFGAVGIMAPAKVMLSAMGLAKPVVDSLAMPLAGQIYDAAVHGQPMDFKKLSEQTGGNIPAFVLQSAILGFLTHGMEGIGGKRTPGVIDMSPSGSTDPNSPGEKPVAGRVIPPDGEGGEGGGTPNTPKVPTSPTDPEHGDAMDLMRTLAAQMKARDEADARARAGIADTPTPTPEPPKVTPEDAGKTVQQLNDEWRQRMSDQEASRAQMRAEGEAGAEAQRLMASDELTPPKGSVDIAKQRLSDMEERLPASVQAGDAKPEMDGLRAVVERGEEVPTQEPVVPGMEPQTQTKGTQVEYEEPPPAEKKDPSPIEEVPEGNQPHAVALVESKPPLPPVPGQTLPAAESIAHEKTNEPTKTQQTNAVAGGQPAQARGAEHAAGGEAPNAMGGGQAAVAPFTPAESKGHVERLRKGKFKEDFSLLQTKLADVIDDDPDTIARESGLKAVANPNTDKLEVRHNAAASAHSMQTIASNFENYQHLSPADSKKQAVQWLQSAMQEELIHARQLIFERGGPEFTKTYAKIWREEVPEVIRMLVRSLRGDMPGRQTESDSQLGAEYERMVIQQRENGTITEAHTGIPAMLDHYEALKLALESQQQPGLEDNISRVGSLTPEFNQSSPESQNPAESPKSETPSTQQSTGPPDAVEEFRKALKEDQRSENEEMRSRPQPEQRPGMWVYDRAKEYAVTKGWSPEEALLDSRPAFQKQALNGVKRAIYKKQPFHEGYTDSPFNIKVPKGYKKEGDLYKFVPASIPSMEPAEEKPLSAAKPIPGMEPVQSPEYFSEDQNYFHEKIMRRLEDYDEPSVKDFARFIEENTKWPKAGVTLRGTGARNEMMATVTRISKPNTPFQVTFFEKGNDEITRPFGDVPVKSLEDGIREAFRRKFTGTTAYPQWAPGAGASGGSLGVAGGKSRNVPEGTGAASGGFGQNPKYKSLFVEPGGKIHGSEKPMNHEGILKSLGINAQEDSDEEFARKRQARKALARGALQGDTLHIENPASGMTPAQRKAIRSFSEDHGLRTVIEGREAYDYRGMALHSAKPQSIPGMEPTAKPDFYAEQAQAVHEQDTKTPAREPDPEQIKDIQNAYAELRSKSDFPTIKIADVMEKAGYAGPTMDLGKQHLAWMWKEGMITSMPKLDWSLSEDRVKAWGVKMLNSGEGQDIALGISMPETERHGRASVPKGTPTFKAANAKITGASDVTLSSAKPIIAYHGTRHEVDKFSADKIGTGEGSQVFGYGLYFAEALETAEAYREKFNQQIEGGVGAKAMAARLLSSGITNEQAIKELRARAGRTQNAEFHARIEDAIQEINQGSAKANLYTVALRPHSDEFLDWDADILDQPEQAKEALARAAYRVNREEAERIDTKYPNDTDRLVAIVGSTGEGAYTSLVQKMGSNRKASEYLASIGIPGIRYFDQGSRTAGSGTRNYVIFDPDDINITHKNGETVKLSGALHSAKPGAFIPGMEHMRAAPDESAGGKSRQENLTEEAEAAGVSLSLETLKGLVRGDKTVMDAVRARIKAKTGEDALWAAKPLAAKLSDLSKSTGLRSAIDDVQKVLSPDDRLTDEEIERFAKSGDPNAIGDARKTGIFLDGITANMDRRRKQFEAALRETREMVAKLPEKQQEELMKRVDEGTPLKAGPFKDAFDEIAKMDAKRTQEAKDWFAAHGQDHWANYQNFLKNIVPHYFEDQEAANKVIDQLIREKKMIGGTGFLKHRADMTMREVVDWAATKGITLKPKHTNVIDAIMDRWGQQERYFGAHEMIARMEANGTGHWVNDSDHYIPKKGEKAVNNIIGNRTVEDAEGNRHRQTFYAAEPSATIVNNYLSAGLRAGHKWIDNYFHAANTLNKFQLGLSFFHGAFVTMEGVVSSFALGLEKVLHGDIRGFKDMALAPFSTWNDWKLGTDIRKTLLDPTSGSSAHQAVVNEIVSGGFRDGLDSFYSNNDIQKFMDALRGHKVFQTVLRAPLALIELVAKPLMEHFVPRMKAAAVYKLAQMHMEQRPDMTPMEFRQRLQEDVRSGNNRFGQMTYDNLHLKKTVKDLLMAMTRSLGWNWGSFAEIGGGVVDWARFAKDAAIYAGLKIGGGKGGKPPGDGGGGADYEPGGAKFPRISNRMAYTLALPLIIGFFGLVLAAMFGQPIRRLRDYYAIPTGEVDDHGHPVRVMLPSYMKDVLSFARSPMQAVINKLHPILSIIGQMLQNKDYFGVEIRHSGDPVMKQLLRELAYAGKELTPFSITNAHKLKGSDVSTGLKIATQTGALILAPAAAGKSDAQNLADDLVRQTIPDKARTSEQAAHSQLRGQIIGLERIGKGQDLLQQSLTSGKINASDVRYIQRMSQMTQLQASVSHLSLDEAERVAAVATPAEKSEIQPMIAAKKVRAGRVMYTGF